MLFPLFSFHFADTNLYLRLDTFHIHPSLDHQTDSDRLTWEWNLSYGSRTDACNCLDHIDDVIARRDYVITRHSGGLLQLSLQVSIATSRISFVAILWETSVNLRPPLRVEANMLGGVNSVGFETLSFSFSYSARIMEIIPELHEWSPDCWQNCDDSHVTRRDRDTSVLIVWPKSRIDFLPYGR